MSLGCGENTGWADGFSDCLGPDNDMQAEMNRDYHEDNPGIVSKLTTNIIKPCVKGGATAAYATHKAINKASITPGKFVQKEVIKQAAAGGCVAGVVDNALEKTVGIGLVTGAKEGINLIVKSNTDIMSGEREMELLEKANKEMEQK